VELLALTNEKNGKINQLEEVETRLKENVNELLQNK
jgi:hypothetical protein